MERAFSQITSVTARGDDMILAALAEVLSGSLSRRLAGPILISLGIAIGTIANIAAV